MMHKCAECGTRYFSERGAIDCEISHAVQQARVSTFDECAGIAKQLGEHYSAKGPIRKQLMSLAATFKNRAREAKE